MTDEARVQAIRQRITDILSPAIDARAPYAKQMIAMLVELVEAEHTRAVLRYTAKGYGAAGENAPSKHWRERAEAAEARAASAEQRVKELEAVARKMAARLRGQRALR